MQSRKINANASIEANNLLSYIKEFCVHANRYKRYKTEESLVLLNRNASLLTTAIQPQYFVNSSINGCNIEITQFFIDLHAMLHCLPIDSDALWSCIAVLQHCSRNLDIQNTLIHEFRFIPLLAHILKKIQAQAANDKQQKILILLQELTYGIRIEFEEPYVAVLLSELVKIVYDAAETNGEAYGRLALSVLINLCYKNFVVLFHFLRSVNISCFSKAIQNYGMLASKMLIIISEDIHLPDQKELHPFLRSNFAAIEDCLKTWNVPYLRHITEFLKDSKAHNGLHQAMLSYEYYCNDIEKLLNYLENHLSLDDTNDDLLRKQQQTCMGFLFDLIIYILQLSSMPDGIADGSENSIISLDSNIGRIYELLINWLDSEVCGIKALNLLNSLVIYGKTEMIVSRIARDPSIIVQLINVTEKAETSPLYTATVLKLFISLLKQSKTEKLILSKISESYFDKILTTVLNYKHNTSDNALSMREIEKSIYCLSLLINFADIAKKAYFEKCCIIMQLPQIQYALARAITSANEDLCIAVLQMTQFDHFPRDNVAKIITKLNDSLSLVKPCRLLNEPVINISTIFKSHRDFINKELEERLQALIESLSLAQQNNQLNNANTSQIIELFNYKIQKHSIAEECMQNSLEQTSQQITSLTQRITLQNAELEKLQNMNFELHINRESLQSQCKDLVCQKDNLKRSVTDLMKKLANHSDALLISEKKLTTKVAEYIELQKSFNDVQKQLVSKMEELEKSQAYAKESNLRIDKLKKTVGAYEVDIKEKVRIIEEKERELIKTQKCLEEQKEARKKCEDVINALEAQLQEKNEQIVNYEAELSETEELRKTIMSLMESKKPKRKL